MPVPMASTRCWPPTSWTPSSSSRPLPPGPATLPGRAAGLAVNSATGIAAAAGYPHLTVPMGLARGLPVGISFIGTAWSDGDLLAMGYAYEQAAPPAETAHLPALA